MLRVFESLKCVPSCNALVELPERVWEYAIACPSHSKGLEE